MAWFKREKKPDRSPNETRAGRTMRKMLKDCASCEWFIEGPGTSMRDSYWICGFDNKAFSKGKFRDDCEHYCQRPIQIDSGSEASEPADSEVGAS